MTIQLPPPDTHCEDLDTGKDVWSYSRPLVEKAVSDAIEALERELAETNEMNDQLRGQNEAVDEACAALEREVETLRKDAEMWRWAVSPRSDQRLNIIAAYNNWDGQDSFEDAVIAARAAAIQHEGASNG